MAVLTVTRARFGTEVPPVIIGADAYGEERPAVTTGDNARERGNRRVEVVFEK